MKKKNQAKERIGGRVSDGKIKCVNKSQNRKLYEDENKKNIEKIIEVYHSKYFIAKFAFEKYKRASKANIN